MSNELIQYICQWIILVIHIISFIMMLCKEANKTQLPHETNMGIIGIIIGVALVNLCLWTAGAYSLIF